MINEIKAQARQHIENVVAGYRNDETRTNYKWKVKAEYQINSNWFVLAIMIGMLVLSGVNSGFLDYPRHYAWYGFGPLLILSGYYLITEKNKRFQERSWFNDGVSDEDILRLCENTDLKPLIKYEIEKGEILTYTSLLESLPDYLGRIEYRYERMQRDALIRKIDQNG